MNAMGHTPHLIKALRRTMVILSISSLLLWAFTGVTTWVAIDPTSFADLLRGFLLTAIHLLAIIQIFMGGHV